jgi:hypothetical protein
MSLQAEHSVSPDLRAKEGDARRAPVIGGRDPAIKKEQCVFGWLGQPRP